MPGKSKRFACRCIRRDNLRMAVILVQVEPAGRGAPRRTSPRASRRAKMVRDGAPRLVGLAISRLRRYRDMKERLCADR